MDATIVSTDVLVIGGGGAGLVAALSAKRNGPPGTRVALADTWMSGRTGHTAFSSFAVVVLEPDDDLEGTTAEIIAGNDWIADQPLMRDVLAMSYERLKDLEKLGVAFPTIPDGRYNRHPTRGLELTRVVSPIGGGLDVCWKLRNGLEAQGVQLLDRVFVTGLMRGGSDRVIGAVGVHSRTGQFHVIRARTTIICTNAITFRSGFARDITGTGTLLAYRAGAHLRNAEFGYLRPGTPKFYFEGITVAIQDGARFVNSSGEPFMERYAPDWGDEADVPQIARAMVLEKKRDMAPLYLDMSGIPPDKRDKFLHGKAPWMDYFYRKLGDEVRTDMFGKTPYYPLNQMTKMGVRTDAACRSDVPGLLAAGLAQAGCANHFAGFHIGMCVGTGWIAGASAIEDLDSLPEPVLDEAEVRALHKDALPPMDVRAEAGSDQVLRQLQAIMFAYDVGVLKRGDRLAEALHQVAGLESEIASLRVPHTHELVRLKETESMLLAARIILETSLRRNESRLSHLREDHAHRDDDNWVAWLDVHEENRAPVLTKTPIPTPLCPVGSHRFQGRHARVMRAQN